MGEAVIISRRPDAIDAREPAASSPAGEVLRDIARGGVSGLVVGMVVGGFGGRLVMRLAAILHPDAAGALTENGNRIGDITVGGTVALVLFGLIACSIAAAVWVVVSPWIPGRAAVRAMLAGGAAIAIGTPVLIIGGNRDFVILDHDPTVVALLVALVGLIGLSISLVDSWLDRRLPPAVTVGTAPGVAYAAVTVLGVVLVLPFVILIFLTSDEYALPLRAGYGLLAVGACTITWWGLRLRGRVAQPPALVIAARGLLAAALILGALTSAPHVARALGAGGTWFGA